MGDVTGEPSSEDVLLSMLERSEQSSVIVVGVAEVDVDADVATSYDAKLRRSSWDVPPLLLPVADMRICMPRNLSRSKLARRLRAYRLAKAPSSSELVRPSVPSSSSGLAAISGDIFADAPPLPLDLRVDVPVRGNEERVAAAPARRRWWLGPTVISDSSPLPLPLALAPESTVALAPRRSHRRDGLTFALLPRLVLYIDSEMLPPPTPDCCDDDEPLMLSLASGASPPGAAASS